MGKYHMIRWKTARSTKHNCKTFLPTWNFDQCLWKEAGEYVKFAQSHSDMLLTFTVTTSCSKKVSESTFKYHDKITAVTWCKSERRKNTFDIRWIAFKSLICNLDYSGAAKTLIVYWKNCWILSSSDCTFKSLF